MKETFAVAALRHWQDAILLQESHRLANADQLYGIAAECGLKSALAEAGAGKGEAALEERYHKHIDKLWAQISVQGLQRRFPKLVAILRAENPFADWSISQRYADGEGITAVIVAEHRKWASRVLGSVGLGGARREEVR
jgi:hypothetical protein